MPIFATAGSKLYIGGVMESASTDFTAADFDSQTWTEITPLETIGTFGDVSEEITFNIIGTTRTQKLKGTRNAGSMEVVAGLNYSDAGQIAVLAAEKEPHDYAFRVVFNDAPEGGTPSERMFIAKVMSATEALDEANSVARLNFTLSINSNIVRVAAAEATP